MTAGLPGTVLVVDARTGRRSVAEWLRRAGHRVVEAADGAQALAALGNPDDLPEAAVIDVRLPDMSGHEVCDYIKGRPSTAALPVVHISDSAALTASADRTRGLERGADAYLTEPVAPEELLATVGALLRYGRARRRAERLAARMTQLNRATLAVYAATRVETLAAAAASGAARLMSSPAAAVVLSPDGRVLRMTSPTPAGRPEVRAAHPGLLQWLGSRALGDRIGAGLAVVPHRDWKEQVPDAVFDGDVCLVLARTKRARPPVCLAVEASSVEDAEDRELLNQLAHGSAMAVEALRTYSEEHSLALTLQRSFLPSRFPRVAGVELAVRYVPASTQAEIGGDFYEAVETPHGLLLAIGDVAGHSLEAAAVMGELRHALRAYAAEGHGPREVLDLLDGLLVRFQPGVTATVCLALVEPGGRRVRIANAGHLPPLLLDPGGGTRYSAARGTLLGLGVGHPEPVVEDVAPGTRVLLVTDGLVEVRGVDLEDSLAALRRTAEEGPADLEQLCDALVTVFGVGKGDDIALLAARCG
ncbi:SpoIIE family protein phosphatase [Streptacidiphilus sp. ASG 303]|uniref:SpoIIE family protein phosphatase n=1 Tax=Streptacidiphilus sp. ASG 303 TaxID=2896847 RepID=UPI0035AFC2B6